MTTNCRPTDFKAGKLITTVSEGVEACLRDESFHVRNDGILLVQRVRQRTDKRLSRVASLYSFLLLASQTRSIQKGTSRMTIA
jgi:hypothetical protein